MQISDKVTDAFFAKDKKTASSSAEDEFFADGKPKEKAAHPEDKTSEQKSVDAGVLAGVKKTSNLEKYLKATWGLSKGQFPHEVRSASIVFCTCYSHLATACLLDAFSETTL